MKYIFDLDNTVVFTDAANNIAYNEALGLFDLPAIETDTRITRDDVFKRYPDLTDEEKNQIVKSKQKHYLPELTVLNQTIIELAEEYGPENCVLWSRADRERVKSVLDYHGIRHFFSDIFITPKKSISEEITFLCGRYSCNPSDLTIYDDEPFILNQILAMGCEAFICSAGCVSLYKY